MIQTERTVSYYEYQQKLMRIFVSQPRRFKESGLAKEEFEETFQDMHEAIAYCVEQKTAPTRWIMNHGKDNIKHQLIAIQEEQPESIDMAHVDYLIGKMRRQRAFEQATRHFKDHAHMMELGILQFDDVANVINQAQDMIAIQDTKSDDFADILAAANEEAIERTNDLLGVPTGFENMDRILGGWEAKRLVTIAAPPHTGKSLLAYNIIKEVGDKMPVTFFALETPKREVAYKLLSALSRVEYTKVYYRAKANEKEQALINMANDRLKEFQINVHDGSMNDIQHIKEVVHNNYHKYDGKQQMVIIDHIGLVTSRTNNLSRNDMITNVANELLRMRDKYNCTIIVLTQMNREGLRNLRNPDLSHIKDSSTIAENSDTLMFIYREDKMQTDVDKQDEMNHTVIPFALVLKKNRSTGRMGVMKFRAELTKQRLVPIHDSEYADLVERVKSTH